MSIWRIFAPRRGADFFGLLHDQGKRTLETCEALVRYLDGKADPEDVKRLEQEADDVRRVLIDELNQTFITPMDREDIFALSRNVDDVADYAKNTVREMQAFEVGPNDHLRDLAGLLLDGARLLESALSHLKDNPGVANDYVVKAKRTENKMNRRYLVALQDLFKGDDVRTMFSLREIYRHLNRGGDRVDAAADVIADVLVKLV